MRQTRSVHHGSRVRAAVGLALVLVVAGLLSRRPRAGPERLLAVRFEPVVGTDADPPTPSPSTTPPQATYQMPLALVVHPTRATADVDVAAARRVVARGATRWSAIDQSGGRMRVVSFEDRSARAVLRQVRAESQRAGHRAGRCGRRSGPGADRGRPSSAARPEGVPARGRVGSAGAEGDHDDRGGRHHGRPPGRAGHRRRPAAAVPTAGEATGGRRHHRRQPGVHPVHRRFAHPGRRLVRRPAPSAARPGLRGLRPGVAGQQPRRRLRGSGHAADLHPAAGRRPGLRRSRTHPRRGPASGGDHPGRRTGRLYRHRVDRRDPGGRAQPGRHQPAEHAAPHRPAGSRRAAPDRRRHPPAEASRSTSSS